MKIKLKGNPSSAAVIIPILIAALFSACAPSRSPSETAASSLEALAEKDQTRAVSVSCAAWEESALAEGASFINVEVGLEDLSCQVDSQSDSEAAVSCSGRYVFSYDAGEDQELDLSGRVLHISKESGEWRMCGYR